MSPAKKTAKSKVSAPRKLKKPATRAPAPKQPAKARVQSASPSAADRNDNDTVKMVRDLAAICERRALTELIIDTEELTLTMRRGETASGQQPTFVTAAPVAPHVAPPEPAPAPEPTRAPSASEPQAPVDDDSHVVHSPFVGTFYRRPNPDADPYVEVGQRVEKGQVLCIVEAMKLMNEIEADVAGTISELLVTDAEPVEYGQPLFKIKPA